ncbi:MAG: rhodanese-like domain-containing protein [Cyanobacteria bacterium J06632_3]
MTTGTIEKETEAAANVAEAVLNKAESAEGKVLDAVDNAQDVLGEVTPVSTEFKPVTPPLDIKKRLDWGEPALTIIDVRDRTAYNQERIMGAIPMPMSNLAEQAKESLELSRDIYLHGRDDVETSSAAMKLHDAGFTAISAIQGGLEAWKAIGGATEGQG